MNHPNPMIALYFSFLLFGYFTRILTYNWSVSLPFVLEKRVEYFINIILIDNISPVEESISSSHILTQGKFR